MARPRRTKQLQATLRQGTVDTGTASVPAHLPQSRFETARTSSAVRTAQPSAPAIWFAFRPSPNVQRRGDNDDIARVVDVSLAANYRFLEVLEPVEAAQRRFEELLAGWLT